MLPDETLHQQGMSGLDREQVLQMLIKLELDSLLSQVCKLLSHVSLHVRTGWSDQQCTTSWHMCIHSLLLGTML